MFGRVIVGALVALFSFGPALAGPMCTFDYPRGFHVNHGTKKHPLLVCSNGDLEYTWGKCTPRVSA
jgi:hypothetical protein